jgi:uncharacterized protein YbcI
LTDERDISEGRPKGALVSELSREIVQLHARIYGRGPTKARTYLEADYAICVLQMVFTPAESTLIETGSREDVRETRHKLQEAGEDQFIAVVEKVTGRQVSVFLSQVDIDSNLAVDFFFFKNAD